MHLNSAIYAFLVNLIFQKLIGRHSALHLQKSGFLNILDDSELCPTIHSSSHNFGNSLDNILVPSYITGCFYRFVLPLTPFSDHAPMLAKINSKSLPSSIRIHNYAFTEPGNVTFCPLWQNYIFLNYPYADTVTDF